MNGERYWGHKNSRSFDVPERSLPARANTITSTLKRGILRAEGATSSACDIASSNFLRRYLVKEEEGRKMNPCA